MLIGSEMSNASAAELRSGGGRLRMGARRGRGCGVGTRERR